MTTVGVMMTGAGTGAIGARGTMTGTGVGAGGVTEGVGVMGVGAVGGVTEGVGVMGASGIGAGGGTQVAFHLEVHPSVNVRFPALVVQLPSLKNTAVKF